MENSSITVGDVTSMAVAMEEKGMCYYTWAASRFKDESVKNVFRRLAEEEKEHARIFRKLLDLPGAGERIGDKAGKYLRMLAESEAIFPHHQEMTPEKVKTPAEALAVGIQAEKDAILFYQELYNSTESKEVREVLSKLLEEEKMHLVELRDSMNEFRYLSKDMVSI